MDTASMKEIIFLFFDVIKALLNLLWRKVKELFLLLWERFFGTADVSREQEVYEEWGVTGEDQWPSVPETIQVEEKEEEVPLQKEEEKVPEVERKVLPVVPERGIPELPESYGYTKITVMVQNPEWLFAYWEICQDRVEKVLKGLGYQMQEVKLVLRVYDVTDIIFTGYNAHMYFDIEVSRGAQNWYIHVPRPGRTYCVDMGFVTPDGTFHILSRSGSVTTPHVGISEKIEETWMCVEGLYEKVYITAAVPGVSEFAFEKEYGKYVAELRGEGAFSPGFWGK